MLERPEDALALARERGLVTLVDAAPGVPSLVGSYAGKIRGSWWGHPKGKLIFNAASLLADSGEVVAVKLVDGKETFVHRERWPALARVATDALRVKAAREALSPAARKLLARVEAAGELVATKQDAKARRELEEALLVLAEEKHTESGKHVTVLRSFEAWLDPAIAKKAARLSLDAAKRALT